MSRPKSAGYFRNGQPYNRLGHGPRRLIVFQSLMLENKPLYQEKNMPEIKTITLALPYHLGSVNCYLVKAEAGYILIDTGSSNQRVALEKELLNACCQPGNLNLIILTHGDFDHTGNAAYLHQKFGAPLAMQPGDFGRLERRDMFASWGNGNSVFKTIAPLLFGFGQSNRVTPDIALDEGCDLTEFGLKAKVLSLPGHSRGSIGILTPDGDLFVGDLLENTKQPALNSIMDDRAAARASVERLKAWAQKLFTRGMARYSRRNSWQRITADSICLHPSIA